MKIKASEMRDTYLDLAKELRKLRNMSVVVIPNVTGAPGTVPNVSEKGLEKLEIRGRIETIQKTALLRSARILRRVLETRGNLMSLRLQ